MNLYPHDINSGNSWIEKGISKHKHDFTIPYIYEQQLRIKPDRDNEYQINYYDVFMCKKCHSFVINDKKDGWYGHIATSFSNEDNTLTKEQNSLPHIVGMHYNRYCNIGYVNKLYFPDGTSWEKNKKDGE